MNSNKSKFILAPQEFIQSSSKQLGKYMDKFKMLAAVDAGQ
jgi:hypothetical protein